MSFDEIYNKYYHELRRFGSQLNVSFEKCEDLIQETFLRFYMELKKDVIFENPRAWLYKVFLNLFRTYINSARYEQLDAGLPVEVSGDLHEDYIKIEKQQIVLEMLGQLTSREKEILLLYHKGFSYTEMAEILGINPNSVGKTIVRAIESLKEKLKTHYHELFEQI